MSALPDELEELPTERRCPNCKAENDFSFTYCHHCLEKLEATPTRSLR